MELIADTDKLIKTSSQLSIAAECLHQCMIDIELLVKSVSGEWLGASGYEYVGKIIALKKEYSNLEKLVEDFSKVLSDAADCYESYDSALARKIETI